MDPSPATQQQPSTQQSVPLPAHQQSTTTTTGPQIRSRITVVCAECKRLKLKCDRRTPCGSCTKRDTISRCIYSPAAAEKVDLHSLNNRLIQVEATLALITSGHTPPAFQSSYPFAHNSASTYQHGSNPHQHMHHHHNAAPSTHSLANDSILISMQELSSIWLEDLELGIPLPSHTSSPLSTSGVSNQSSLSQTGYIKLEPSPTEIGLTHPRPSYDIRSTTVTVESDGSQQPSSGTTLPSRSSSPVKQRPTSRSTQQRQQRGSAQFLLPPLSIYYPVAPIPPPGSSTTSSSSFPAHPSTSSPSYISSPQQPQHNKPQVTPQLLALLPAFHTCTHLLRHAEEVFRMRPVPFWMGWKEFEKQCLNILGSTDPQRIQEKKKRQEHEEQLRRARAIYFGQGRVPEPPTEDDVPSLTFFAAVCAVLAIGAHVSTSSSSPTSHGHSVNDSPSFLYALSQQALSVWDSRNTSHSPDDIDGDEGDNEEGEKLNYLLACLLGVVYFLITEPEEDKSVKAIFPMVGKMVNFARSMGLGNEVSVQKTKSEKRSSGTNSSSKRQKEKEARKQEARRMIWWDVVFYDLYTSDTLGHPPLIPPFSYSTKLPACSAMFSAEEDEESEEDANAGPAGDEVRFADETVLHMYREKDKNHDRERERYFGIRCRLTQLAQTIKHRIAHPDCCCGYTLDQAANLEAEVRSWLAALPSSLRIFASPPPLTAEDPPDRNVTTLLSQSCELAIVANLLILKIYLPFLRSHNTPNSSTTNSPSGASGSSSDSCSPALHAVLSAAQGLVRAARTLQNSPSASSLSKTSVTPSMFDFLSMERAVFLATVICSHSSLVGKTNTSEGAVIDDVASGLDMLHDLSLGQSSDKDLRRKVADALRRRFSGKGLNMLKRKHSQVDVNFSVSILEKDVTTTTTEATAAGFNFPAYPSGTPTQETPVVTEQHSQTQQSSKDRSSKGHNDKDKKSARKYPHIGIRIRPGMPFPLKSRTQAGTNSSGNSEGRTKPHGSIHVPPLMTSAPAGQPLNQQEQHQQTPSSQPPQHPQNPPPSTAPSTMHDSSGHHSYRSRSSSVSHDPRLHPQQSDPATGSAMDFNLPFGPSPSDHIDMHAVHMRRFSTHDIGKPQQQQQQSHTTSHAQPFSSPPIFDPSQPTNGSFESHRNAYNPPRGSFDHGHSVNPSNTTDTSFGAVSSPYLASSAPISSAGSPYGSNSGTTTGNGTGHPSTPTFGALPHQTSPPTFGSVSVNADTSSFGASNPGPTNYFHRMTNGYEGTYDNTAGGVVGHVDPQNMLPMDTSMDQTSNSMVTGSVPSTPIYEKQYDMKPSMDGVAVHHRHQQRLPHQQQQQHVMSTSVFSENGNHHPHPLGPMPPPQQQQQPQQQQHQQHQQHQQQWPPPPGSQQQPLVSMQHYWPARNFYE